MIPGTKLETSSKENKSGWLHGWQLPSLPSISSIPSACKGALKFFTDRFQSKPTSPPAPLSAKTAVDFTKKTLPKATPKAQSSSSRKYFLFGLAATICVAVYGRFTRNIQAQTPQFDIEPPFRGLHFRQISTEETSLGYLSRHLLSINDPSNDDPKNFECTMVTTEGVDFQAQLFNWDVFNEPDRIIVSAEFSDNGITLAPSQMAVTKSINVPYGIVALYDSTTFYVGSQLSSSTSIYSGESPSSLNQVGTFNTGTATLNMIVSEGELLKTGTGTLVDKYNLDNPRKPTLVSTARNSSITGQGIVTSPNQIGIPTNSGFFYLDRISLRVIGMIPNLRCVSATVSTDNSYYFVGTTTSFLCLSTSSPTIINSFSLPNINTIVYSEGLAYVSTSTGIFVYDVQNPSNGMPQVGFWPGSPYGLLFVKNQVFVSSDSTNGFSILDRTNKTQPKSIPSATNLFTELGAGIIFYPFGDNIILQGQNAISIIPRGDFFTISGKPKGGTKGNSTITFTASTLSGGAVNASRSCLRINKPAINQLSPIPKQIFGVGRAASGALAAGTFQHVNKYSMGYLLSCLPPNGISMNTLGHYLGTPQASNVGTATCTVVAADDFSSTTVSDPFQVQVINGPTLSQIPNQIAIRNQQFSLPIAATSQDTNSTNLTYTFSGLPSGFNFTNGTLSGTVSSLGSYPITVTATDPNSVTSTNPSGVSDTKSFVLYVGEPGVPVFVNPPASTNVLLNVPFVIPISRSAALNPSNPNTPISISFSGLPKWASFNTELFQIEGTPPPFAKTLYDVPVSVQAVATMFLPDGQPVTTTYNFNLNVSGTSVVQYVLSFGGITILLLGTIAALRIRIFNKMVKTECGRSCLNAVRFKRCYDPVHYPQETVPFWSHQSIEYVFSGIPGDQIATYLSLVDGQTDPTPGLPTGLDSSGFKIKRIFAKTFPESVIKSAKVYPTDPKGYHLGEVNFEKAAITSTYSRALRTPKEKVLGIEYYTGHGNSKTLARTPPEGLGFDKEKNSITAPFMPRTPVTIRVMGESNRVLEVIYFNEEREIFGKEDDENTSLLPKPFLISPASVRTRPSASEGTAAIGTAPLNDSSPDSTATKPSDSTGIVAIEMSPLSDTPPPPKTGTPPTPDYKSQD
jgi:hypothetical protein